LRMKLKRGLCVFWYFFILDLCSATSMKSSRWDLLNYMAEHRPILKNHQNACHPRFGFTPKTGIAFPKTGVLFLLCICQCSFIYYVINTCLYATLLALTPSFHIFTPNCYPQGPVYLYTFQVQNIKQPCLRCTIIPFVCESKWVE